MKASLKKEIEAMSVEDRAKCKANIELHLPKLKDGELADARDALAFINALQAGDIPKDRAVKSGMVKVRALHALNEDGHRNKGDVFETTPERAKALGCLVEPAK